MKLTQQEKDKIEDEFYKECGQYCNDSFGEIADYWLSKIDSILEEKVAEFLENKAKEKDNKLDSYRAMQIIANTLIKIIPCKK